MPAHKQIIFIAGIELVMSTFITTLIRIFAVWAVKTHMVQTMMQNLTDSAMSAEIDLEGNPGFKLQGNEL